MKLLLILFFLTNIGLAQTEIDGSGKTNRNHSMAFLLSHTHVSQGISDGKRKWLTLPSISLDYNFIITEKIIAGLHNDLIIENFKVEKSGGGAEIERTRPWSSAVTAGYKPGRHFIYQFGLGGEFAKEGNFFLTRIGVEYSLELDKDWEFISNFIFDFKWNAYDSFGLGVGISKSFGKSK